MTNRGMTLIELLVVIAIIGILLAALGMGYEGWIGRYNIEKATKQLYSDLMKARMMALNGDRRHFVVLRGASYSIVEDTDEDGVMDSSDRTISGFPRELPHPVSYNNGTKVTFNARGLMSNIGTAHFISDKSPDFDCITIAMSRIVIGLYDDGHHKCMAK